MTKIMFHLRLLHTYSCLSTIFQMRFDSRPSPRRARTLVRGPCIPSSGPCHRGALGVVETLFRCVRRYTGSIFGLRQRSPWTVCANAKIGACGMGGITEIMTHLRRYFGVKGNVSAGFVQIP